MKRALAAVIAVAFAITAPASAEWYHNVQDDPFSGDQHIAVGTDFAGFSTAFRCTKQSDLTLMFIMPDKPDATILAAANQMEPKIAVIIDDPCDIARI